MDLFLVTVHCLMPHPAWVIAINSSSRLPNDVLSRQGLIDRWRGYVPKHARGTSPLFIVRVRTLMPDNGWLIAIYSNVLPKVQRSRSLSPDSVAKWRQGPMVTLCSNRPFLYYWCLQRFIDSELKFYCAFITLMSINLFLFVFLTKAQ